MIETILPPGTATSEAFGDPAEAALFPGEEALIARAVEGRRREFTTTRHCARLALRELGYEPVAIPSGERREPIWPEGVVGALTHCLGYRAAALARAEHVPSLGIDAEPHLPLPHGVLDSVSRPEERVHLAELTAAAPEVHWDRLLFSAKESVYKAWFPLARRWLDFTEATLEFDPSGRGFRATLHQEGPRVGGSPLVSMTGRWLVDNGLIATSAVVTA
ncbi:4'-phosphopantetheinyl transferase superfamily protein [Streptomyces sp. NBC_01216]|uniref:4'-phosphopantetheinyl transferase family protein n=1 Tax=unclassified Streptomyces TaxID=2593676 RepID=UPI002E104DF1|nr:4'-phosphopantetheinyl transferase superfamily protein [Streptomyces sp. NBC_01216]